MENDDGSSSHSPRKRKSWKWGAGSAANYLVETNVLAREKDIGTEDEDVNRKSLTAFFEAISPGISSKLTLFLNSKQFTAECWWCDRVMLKKNGAVKSIPHDDFYFYFKNLPADEFSAEDCAALLMLGEHIITAGYATFGFSFMSAACELPPLFLDLPITIKKSTKTIFDLAYYCLGYSKKPLPEVIAKNFINCAKLAGVKQHLFLDFLLAKRDKAADLEKAFKSLGIPSSATPILLLDMPYHQVSYWADLLDSSDINLVMLDDQNSLPDELRKVAAGMLINGEFEMLRGVWSVKPEVGLFMACHLRELADRSKIDRPRPFYDCLIERIDQHPPSAISDFCRRCVPNFKKRIGEKRTQMLLALPAWKPTTSTTTTTTTSTSGANANVQGPSHSSQTTTSSSTSTKAPKPTPTTSSSSSHKPNEGKPA